MNYLKLFGIAAFAIGAILYMASGEEHDLVIGQQNYDLGEYVNISEGSAAHVIVRVGEDYALNVNADEKDLALLKVYVRGQTLVIENKRSVFNSWGGPKPEITISLPKLKKYTVNGSSDVVIEGIHGSIFKAVINGSGQIKFTGGSEELKAQINGSGGLLSPSFETVESDISINGSGEVKISGKCKNLDVEINGSGDFAAKDFICEKVEVDIAGSGDLVVYASAAIDVDVDGSGDVYVYGNPDKVIDRSRKKNHIKIK
jgi:hypothetical protein